MTSKDPALPGGGALPGRRMPEVNPLVRAGHLEYDRILFFSDAIFAIAITLLVAGLVVDVRPRETASAGRQLHDAIPGIRGFAISFVVIGVFWLGHHTIFRFIMAVDRRLIFLNLLFLGTIAFLPYPTALLSSSTEAPAVIFYAACCAASGLTEAACWVYATRPGADLAPTAAPVRVRYLLRILTAPAVFLLSIPVAAFAPVVALFTWILIWVANLVVNRFWPLPDAVEAVG
jgi:uncharacterized membrane protein